MRGLLITGTDTDVGKTYVATLIAKQLVLQQHRVGVYKPVCSGAVNGPAGGEPLWNDVEFLHDAIGKNFPKDCICPQKFNAALAPPVSAQQEGRTVDEGLLYSGLQKWKDEVDGIIIEGVGGWKCPISENLTLADFAQSVGFPVLVVAAQKLGTINHTLLTVESIRASGLHVAGLVLNQPTSRSDCMESNAEQILKFAEIPFLSLVGFGHETELRCEQTSASIDWWESMSKSTTSFY